MHVKNSPTVVEIQENRIDRLYMENCLFDNIKEAGVVLSRINIPERPVSITFGGRDGNSLFATTQTSLYGVKVK
jgi:sugar lactone lactonase YvrE